MQICGMIWEIQERCIMMLKLIMFAATLALLCPTLNASKLSLMEESETEAPENILYTACLYRYADNQDAATPFVFLKEDWTLEQVAEEIHRAPIHVNLIERWRGNASLEAFKPYASSIYALSLDDNCFEEEIFEQLEAFPEIRILGLANNSLYNPPLEQLKKLENLKHLREVDLQHNRIEPSKIVALRKFLPGVTIIGD